MCNSAWKSPCSVCAVKPEYSSCTAVLTNCIFQMLHTDKADKKNHGKGISIVKSIAEKFKIKYSKKCYSSLRRYAKKKDSIFVLYWILCFSRICVNSVIILKLIRFEAASVNKNYRVQFLSIFLQCCFEIWFNKVKGKISSNIFNINQKLRRVEFWKRVEICVALILTEGWICNSNFCRQSELSL